MKCGFKMSEQNTMLKINSILNGKYIVEKYLGGGAFGEVYRVKHKYLKNRRAIKIFKNSPDIKGNPSSIEKLLEEAILLTKFDHKNIVKVHDAGIFTTDDGDGHVFFEMDFYSKDLDEYWKSFGARFMPVDIVVTLIKQICYGLDVLHSENPPMIHRDIKPQNIMVDFDNDGCPIAKLTDFGLVKAVNPSSLYASAKGTLAFKAPEFLEKKDDTSTDIFAVGVTFYMLLTDNFPYPIDSEFDVMTGSWLKNKPKPISEYNPLVRDEKLEEIVFTAISTDPEKRYRDAKELLDAITEWENSKDSSAPKSEDIKKESKASEPERVSVTAKESDQPNDSGSIGSVSLKTDRSNESGSIGSVSLKTDHSNESGSIGSVSLKNNQSNKSVRAESVFENQNQSDVSENDDSPFKADLGSLSNPFVSENLEEIFGGGEISEAPSQKQPEIIEEKPEVNPDELIRDALWAVSNSLDYERGVDYLNQAFNQDPELKSVYGSKLELWKCFILMQNPDTIDEGIFNLKKLADENTLIKNDYAFAFDLLSKKDAKLLEKEALFSNAYNKPKEASTFLELAMLLDVTIKNRYKNKLKILKNGTTI